MFSVHKRIHLILVSLIVRTPGVKDILFQKKMSTDRLPVKVESL